MTKLETEVVFHVEETEDETDIKSVATQVDDAVASSGSPGSEIDGKLSWKVILAFIALAGQLNAYEMTLLVPASVLSYVNEDLGPSNSYTWIANTWPLCAAVMTSVSGRLSDIFGRRYFLLVGSLIGFLGTIVGATGQSINQMIVSGIMFGIASGIQETFYAGIMELVPNSKRTFIVGMSCATALPCLFSPLISYALMDGSSLGWRAPYWFMCAFHGAAGLFLFFFYHPPTFHTKHGQSRSKRQMILELDYVGLFLFTSGCVLVLVGLNFGGREYPWKSVQTLAPICIGVTLLIAFGLWECYAKLSLPLMPPRLFRNFRGFDMILIVCFVCGMLYYSFPVLWPRESAILFISTDDLILRGVYANLSAWGTWISGSSVAFICSRLNHERWQIVLCIVIQTALIGSLASVGIHDKAQAIATVFTLSCFVNQPFYISFSVISLGIDDQSDIGAAAGILSTIRLMGGAIGVAVYSSIISNTYPPRLIREVSKAAAVAHFPKSDLPALIKAAAANTAKAYQAVPHITKEVLELTEVAVKQSYAHAASVAWLSAVGFGGLAIVCACFIRSTPLHMKTLERAVTLEDDLPQEKVVDVKVMGRQSGSSFNIFGGVEHLLLF